MFVRWLPVTILVWVVAALAVVVAEGCYPASSPPSTTDGATPVDPSVCILETVTSDLLSGMTPKQAYDDAATKCLLSASLDNLARVEQLWAAHHASIKRLSLERSDAGRD